MPKKSPSSPAQKIAPAKKVIAIRPDLVPRLVEKARELKQNPNQLVNLITEGGLDAMDAEGPYESPIVQLYRSSHGKTLMTSKALMTICSIIVPDVYEIDRHEKQILLDLVNKHDGPLSLSIFKEYRQLAVHMNKQRIENEALMAKLQKANKAQ
jgi:uncharacterized protein (DUF1501 family)